MLVIRTMCRYTSRVTSVVQPVLLECLHMYVWPSCFVCWLNIRRPTLLQCFMKSIHNCTLAPPG